MNTVMQYITTLAMFNGTYILVLSVETLNLTEKLPIFLYEN